MIFNSLKFLLFFPVVVLIFYIIPKKARYFWLLVSSYFFYMCWSVKYVLLLLTSTAVTYACGILIDKSKKAGQKKAYIILSLLINLGILFVFKYFNFSVSLLAGLFKFINVELSFTTLNILLPVGISFYTFQAIGYTIDVYRGEIGAERNFFKYALFVSFFPQLVAGPIERSGNLLPQLDCQQKFDFKKAKEGAIRMLWGFFLKIVIADRLAIFVDEVYANSNTYSGIYVVIASVMFAFQIYCDFYGYSTIAVGAAKILGIDLMDNFKSPYLAGDVAEFWRGWHISLTTFFRDYVYIPLGGNRKGKCRKYLNKLIVFSLSGLWHGASLAFVVWGGLNGLYQIVGEALLPLRKKAAKIFHFDAGRIPGKLIKSVVTFALVDFSWIFFRAGNLKTSIAIIRNMFVAPSVEALNKDVFFSIIDEKNFILLMICLLILALVDVWRRNADICKFILQKKYWFRCAFFVLMVLIILTFGMYGPEYDAKNFIYFQF